MSELAARFEAERPRLLGLAYRMLGSRAEAEDAVQDAWLRLARADAGAIAALGPWLTQVVSRLCLDRLKSAVRVRETYVGPWLPEPVDAEAIDGPEEREMLKESISAAFLLVLERLQPTERAAFLLHDVFDYSHGEVAAILGKSEAACRQTVSRARKRVAEGRPRFGADATERDRLAGAFFAALETGEVEPIAALLAADAELWTDGGGKATAALNVIRGPEAIARFFVGIAKKGPAGIERHPIRLNGAAAVLLLHEGAPLATLSVHAETQGRVSHVFVVRNPDKLTGIEAN